MTRLPHQRLRRVGAIQRRPLEPRHRGKSRHPLVLEPPVWMARGLAPITLGFNMPRKVQLVES